MEAAIAVAAAAVALAAAAAVAPAAAGFLLLMMRELPLASVSRSPVLLLLWLLIPTLLQGMLLLILLWELVAHRILQTSLVYQEEPTSPTAHVACRPPILTSYTEKRLDFLMRPSIFASSVKDGVGRRCGLIAAYVDAVDADVLFTSSVVSAELNVAAVAADVQGASSDVVVDATDAADTVDKIVVADVVDVDVAFVCTSVSVVVCA